MTKGPPPLPPPLPHRPESWRGGAPPPPPAPTPVGEPQARPSSPPGPGGRPPPKKGRRRGKGNGGWTCSREPTPACRSNAHSGTENRPRPTSPSHNDSPHRDDRGGVQVCWGPRGSGPRAAPHPPPLLGRHFSPGRTRTPEGNAPATRRGPGLSTAGRPPEGEQGARGATPPSPPPAPPPARKPRGPRPHPPR